MSIKIKKMGRLTFFFKYNLPISFFIDELFVTTYFFSREYSSISLKPTLRELT